MGRVRSKENGGTRSLRRLFLNISAVCAAFVGIGLGATAGMSAISSQASASRVETARAQAIVSGESAVDACAGQVWSGESADCLAEIARASGRSAARVRVIGG